jgi:two-component system sensor histidine kinase MprB
VAWLLASALAGALGWLAALRAVRPIEQLTSAAEEVAATERLDVQLNTEAPAEIGRLASAFGSMLASLHRSRIQQQQLASDAGHELRTPLTALRTNLETLRRRGEALTPEQRTELLDAAITEAGELSALSTELVDLASDAGRGQEERQLSNLRELVDDVVGLFRSRTTQPLNVFGDGATFEGRPLQLARAISNLVDNARKWSPPDEPIDITVDGTSVTVRDRGPGIPEADLPHAFERFFRSVDARTTPGSGLGLAIVETIVTGHGGTVIARNHPDGGAEVGFVL